MLAVVGRVFVGEGERSWSREDGGGAGISM